MPPYDKHLSGTPAGHLKDAVDHLSNQAPSPAPAAPRISASDRLDRMQKDLYGLTPPGRPKPAGGGSAKARQARLNKSLYGV